MDAIIALAIIGFLLLAAEVFVPGLILGLLGGTCLVVAVVIGYHQYGIVGGTGLLAALAVLTLAGFIAWMFAFPHTAIGRRLVLNKSLPLGDDLPAASRLLGKEGVAITPLRPAGTALIDGRRTDVVAESAFVEPGAPVLVALVDGARVVVRKKV